MEQKTLSRRTLIFYLLFAIDLIILGVVYAIPDSPVWRFAYSLNVHVPLGVGLVAIGGLTITVGIWATIQKARGKHDHPGFLGACLVFTGVIMTVWSVAYLF